VDNPWNSYSWVPREPADESGESTLRVLPPFDIPNPNRASDADRNAGNDVEGERFDKNLSSNER